MGHGASGEESVLQAGGPMPLQLAIKGAWARGSN